MKNKTATEFLMGICMLLLVTAVAHYMTQSRLTAGVPETRQGPVVVVDAGHGACYLRQ